MVNTLFPSQLHLEDYYMIAKRPFRSCRLFFFDKNTNPITPNSSSRPLTTSPLPIEPPNSQPHESLCFSLADQLLSRGLIPSAQGVIDRLIKHSKSVAATFSSVDFAHSRGLDLNWSSLIQKLLTLGKSSMAEAVFAENVLGRGMVPVPSSVLQSMIICYCRLGKLREALICWNDVFREGYLPCQTACNVLIRELCLEERVLEAFGLFTRMVDNGVFPSVWCYNYLIDGLCFCGNFDEALIVFNEMIKSGTPPTSHLCKSLVYSLCKRGHVSVAESLCKYMEESHGFRPDKKVYTSLIYGYCMEGNTGMAKNLFERMLDMGCEPDAFAYNTMIYGFVRLDNVDSGLELLKKMVESGLHPNVVTYNIMMSKNCKDGKFDRALLLLNDMISSDLSPDVRCYTVLISALYKANRLEEAEDLFHMMLSSNVAPDHVLYFNMVYNYPKGQELRLALVVSQALAMQGCSLAHVVLQALAMRGCNVSGLLCSTPSHPNEVFEKDIDLLFSEILGSYTIPANEVLGVLLSALCAGGKINHALHVLDKMIVDRCKPLLSTYNSLIRNLSHEARVKEAMSLITRMHDQGMLPNLETYLVMVNEHCKRGDQFCI